MSDGDRGAVNTRNIERPDVAWIDDPDDLDTEGRTRAFPPDGLITVRYLWDAVRRHSVIWLSTALIGLLAGLGTLVLMPGASVSSTKLLLVHRDGDDPERAMATDSSLAATNTVASRVIDKLGLRQTPEQVLESYSASQLTDRVLEITARAPTSEEATELAAAVGEVFLDFRMEQVDQQVEPLRDDLADAKGAVANALQNLEEAGGDPDDPDPEPSPEHRAYTKAIEEQQFFEQQILDQQATTARMSSSRVLDPAAPVPHSQFRSVVTAAGTGLVGGLMLGLAFVVARALISDRLWRRQDISAALGAPVGLSVGRPRRWPGWRRRLLTLQSRRNAAVRRALPYLRAQVVWDTPKPALALVNIGDIKDGVLVTMALAESYAIEGSRVLIVDLTSGQALQQLSGLPDRPGVYGFELDGSIATVRVYVPEALAAPRTSLPRSDDFRAEWAVADLVLVLATLSPATGAEHLRPWSKEAVAVIGAGKASAAELAATGEILRVAGIHMRTSVLVRTDRSDLSIGGGTP